jgi:hypothetical protein
MMLDLARQLKSAKPFRTFRVVMRSGKRFDIRDPEKVVVAATKVIAFLPRLTEMPESEIELVYVPRR